MSIIEKAVDKLRKPGQGKEQDVARGRDPEFGVEFEASTSNVESSSETGFVPKEERPGNFIALPVDSLKQKGMITLDKPRSQIAESYRMIKRPLITNIERKGDINDEHVNLIMVTSSLQGEGKTFTALNLALSISMEEDKTVLFIDADFSKATASKLLGVPPESPGMIDLLENPQMDVSDVMFNTDVSNLKIIPAGNLHARSTEFLASVAMRDLMLELSERYQDRIVIFDSPPLLLTTEASVLVKLMGQIVFVVAAEQTSKGIINDALEHIGRDKPVGMVLNKTQHYPLEKLIFGYGYGYGYGYSYGYGHGQGESEKSRPWKRKQS